ncbi:VgrG protein, partial [Campylobacter jejuni]|nr:VgrG protein [Campylobacter coli]EDO8381618.1 VgrG protein [Campylobacter jejuni]EIC6876327.1 VgrG protein [Campylobacter jejuni]EIQ8738280.1 VgrG protein [Campylobacter jejuni]
MIISFLDDDIDKPYVSGSLYNGANPSLVNLPFNDHQTSLSSKTIGVNEEGYNELTLSNIKDKEQIYLKAQKDYDELVQHNFTQRILNDKDSIVDGIYNERIKKVHTQTIDLAKNVNVGGEYLTNVGLSKDTIVGLSNTLNVGVDNKVRVAKNSHE